MTLYYKIRHAIRETLYDFKCKCQRFEHGGWYIEPGINSDGYWWADIEQTVLKEKEFKET